MALAYEYTAFGLSCSISDGHQCLYVSVDVAQSVSRQSDRRLSGASRKELRIHLVLEGICQGQYKGPAIGVARRVAALRNINGYERQAGILRAGSNASNCCTGD